MDHTPEIGFRTASGNTAIRDVRLQRLGRVGYKHAWDIQEALFEPAVELKVRAKYDPDTPSPENHLILCEHPPVFTLGKSGRDDHLLLDRKQLSERSIEFFRNNRGGDITFHGPGQVVGYPILDLEQFQPDIRRYMHALGEVIIRTIAEYGLKGERMDDAIGIWLDKDIPHKARKICAFGVKSSRWITMHGWAINVNTDLDYFNFIVPCGIPDKGVTSLRKELGREIPLNEVEDKILHHFREVFSVRFIE